MKERPILFSAPMVRAVLRDIDPKTQTRRICKLEVRAGMPEPEWQSLLKLCPYGQPGDRLWVREAFSGPHIWERSDDGEVPAVPPGTWPTDSPIWYWADGEPTHGDWTRPRPSIHMPRWASRILLEVTKVRVERLQDISEADAVAEGCQWPDEDDSSNLPDCPNCLGTGLYTAFNPLTGGALPDADCRECDTPVKRYRLLWEQINGPGSWDANPWVWVVEFRRLQ